jgi:hypothetical protein
MAADDLSSREVAGSIPPPENFDPLTAHPGELLGYGIPRRPDPRRQPGLSALWEQQALHYRSFEHLKPELASPLRTGTAMTPEAVRLNRFGSCGYELTSHSAPFAALFVTWTVPNLRYTSAPQGFNNFRTFVGLGFLDTHVEMTVDPAHNVTATITALGVSTVGLPVQAGDALSASMCLDTAPPGRATYVLANETRSQTVNFSFDSGFPPAVTINAGISMDTGGNPTLNALAKFGLVYFDDISAFTTDGTPSLTGGQAITMVDLDGTDLARPARLTDHTFRIERVG